MPKYIELEKAINLFYPVDPENDGSDGCTTILKSSNYTSVEIESMLSDLPTVDANPVVYGRWETNADTEEEIKDFTCSACKYQLCDIDTSVIMPGENDFYFCPNCGATMNQEDQI